MGTLVSLFGALLILSLTISGLLLLVAPALGRHMLQKTASTAGLFFVLLLAFNLAWNFLRSVNTVLLIIGVMVVSTVAYFVRERRLGRSSQHHKPHHAERTPVLPHHMVGEDE